MRDDREPTDGGNNAAKDMRIETLALTAVRQLAGQRVQERSSAPGTTVEDFCEALVAPSDQAHQNVISLLVARGVPAEQIYGKFIPAAARMLGERWVRDELGFMDVTTGAARLQNLVRAYSCSQAPVSVPLGQSVLLVVPSFEQHTLGAFLAADAFRRAGLWVHLAIWQEPADIAAQAKTGQFGLIGISASCTKFLEPLEDFVEKARRLAAGTPPIVIGGALVNLTDELERKTGADFATNDPRLAVANCGLAGNTDPFAERHLL